MLVLKVCLDEIERSRPFLLVLLGDRYGTVMPEERIASVFARLYRELQNSPLPFGRGAGGELTSVGFPHPQPPSMQIAKVGPLISGKLGHPSGRPGLTGRS